MLLESLEEGVVRWNEDLMIDGEEKWYDVGAVIGEILEEEDEEEEDLEEWTWQAYLDEKDE